MPLENLLKDALPIRLNHIPMARNQALKIPLIYPRHTMRKPHTITCTNSIPDQTLLSKGRAPRVRQGTKHFSEDARCCAFARLAELLCSWQVEEEIGSDHGPGGTVVEDEFLVHVGVDVFPVELSVEFG